MIQFAKARVLRRARFLPGITIAGVILIWLAPITFLGRMPIGGDVTSFFLPLMSYYHRALVAGRIPLWNELWGFGFPMLAESQAGVFYPPHLILFWLFETETAYSINIVLHSLLAGWFAYVCGRQFGLKPWGATLAALVFAGNGFFIIHFPHQWSYTTGCWMPLAVALAWRAMGRAESRGRRAEGELGSRPSVESGTRNAEHERRHGQTSEGGTQSEGAPAPNENTAAASGPCARASLNRPIDRSSAGNVGDSRQRLRAAVGLALVLAVQMLAGHFQLAFYTQVVVLLMGVICTARGFYHRVRTGLRGRASGTPRPVLANPIPGHGSEHSGTARSSTEYLVLSTKRHGSASASSTSPQPGDRLTLTTPAASPLPIAHQPWALPYAILWVVVPTAAAFLLAAVQILPTHELIQIALPEGRDFEYLSGFANTPFHLVSYLLPTLFHVNPLWRPVAWDPFHTSPEECFSYVGLLPLCLAVGAAWRWRREPRVRLWVLLVVITLLLSLGPYQPLFRVLIRLPGFDGFRSTARWSLATALFLALLAGRAMDGVRAIERLRLWLRRLVVTFVLAGGFCFACAAVFVIGGAAGAQNSWASNAVQWAERAWSATSPWDGSNLKTAASQAYEPPRDPWAIPALARLGYRLIPQPGESTTWGPRGLGVRVFTLAGERRRIVLQEVLPPVALLGVILGCLYFPPWPRSAPRWLVLGLAALDLGAAAWLRPTEFVPSGRVMEQSPVLSYLAENARAHRVYDFHQNLVMLAGAAPARAYRTVDIQFATQSHNPDRSMDQMSWYHRGCDREDIRWEIWDENPSALAGRSLREGERQQVLIDRTLAEILYGRKFAEVFGQSASTFVIRQRDPDRTGHVWYWDASEDSERFERLTERTANRNAKPSDLTYFWLYLSPARRVPWVRASAESLEVDLDSTGPGMLIISELAYPGWEAKISLLNGATVPAEVIVHESGCLLVPITMSGKLHVELSYHSRSFERGFRISAATAATLLLGSLVSAFLRRRGGVVSY